MSRVAYRGYPVCNHGSPLPPLLAAVAIVLGFGYYYDQAHPKHPHPVAAPAPAPAPPKVITITHQVTRVVHDHPLLSGWQLVAVVAIVAVMVVGGLSVARHLR